MTECLFCKGPHEHSKCPLFGSTKTYLQQFAPKPPSPPRLGFPPKDEPRRSSLPTTQWERFFGPGQEGLLQDVVDHPDLFTHDEVNLAWAILGGVKKVKALDEDDRALLDHIAQLLAEGTTAQPKVKNEPPRERPLEADEGPPRDEDYETLVAKGQVDPSDG